MGPLRHVYEHNHFWQRIQQEIGDGYTRASIEGGYSFSKGSPKVISFAAVKARRRHCAARWLLSVGLLASAISNAMAGWVHLGWSPVTDTNVVGVHIYYGAASRTYTHVISPGLATEVTISGLRDGFKYFFAAVSYYADGSQSDYSPEDSEYIPAPNKSANTFGDVSGAYNGLFFATNQATSAGAFSLFVDGRGVYSGYLQTAGVRASFRGQLDPWCQATSLVSEANNRSLTLRFHIGNNGPGQLIGQISDGAMISVLTAGRAWSNTRTAPAPFAGRYTCVLPGQGSDPSSPEGYGFATAQITTRGLAMLAGTLADGTHFSRSAPVSEDATWPFYAPLYSGGGSVVSLLTFTNRASDDLNGMMRWIKPAMSNTRYYPGGFANQSQMIGSIYNVPSPSTQPVLNLPNTSIAFTGGDLGSGFANVISIGSSSRVMNHSSNSLSMTFSIPNGTFRGTVVDPVNNRALPFTGVTFQKNASGYGLLFGTHQSSSVLIGSAFSLLSPVIISDLSDQSVLRGRNAIFSLNASGPPPLSYRWLVNGAVVAGAAESSFTISNALNTGTYRAIVGNAYGSATSRLANLLVGIPPQALGMLQSNSCITLRMQGTPGFGYVLQAATNLTPPIYWQNVLTNIADSNGSWSFTDTNVASEPNSFFRVAAP